MRHVSPESTSKLDVIHCNHFCVLFIIDELKAVLHQISSGLNDVLKRVQHIEGEIQDMKSTTEARPAQPKTKVPLIVRVSLLASYT